jgi:hypothetical protein
VSIVLVYQLEDVTQVLNCTPLIRVRRKAHPTDLVLEDVRADRQPKLIISFLQLADATTH